MRTGQKYKFMKKSKIKYILLALKNWQSKWMVIHGCSRDSVIVSGLRSIVCGHGLDIGFPARRRSTKRKGNVKTRGAKKKRDRNGNRGRGGGFPLGERLPGRSFPASRSILSGSSHATRFICQPGTNLYRSEQGVPVVRRALPRTPSRISYWSFFLRPSKPETLPVFTRPPDPTPKRFVSVVANTSEANIIITLGASALHLRELLFADIVGLTEKSSPAHHREERRPVRT